MDGYMGKILRVNLSTRSITTEPLKSEIARKFVGGRGLSAKILFDELKPGVDPLGPENKLVVAAGPMGAIPFSGNSRFSVCAKSPLGLGWGESYSGGYMAPKIKQSGFDVFIIEGVSKTPVWLYANEAGAELRDASKYWGKTTQETENGIKKELGHRQAPDKRRKHRPRGRKDGSVRSHHERLARSRGALRDGRRYGLKKTEGVGVQRVVEGASS